MNFFDFKTELKIELLALTQLNVENELGALLPHEECSGLAVRIKSSILGWINKN
jgi:hypothetical protein